MRSAEQWLKYLQSTAFTIDAIKQIQQDAIASARDAALIEAAAVAAKRYDDPAWNGHYQNAGIGIRDAILALRTPETKQEQSG